LPQRVKLEGEWEVGLAEIIYPNSWFNLDEYNDNNVIELKVKNPLKKDIIPIKAWVRPGRYCTVSNLLQSVSRGIKNSLGRDKEPGFRVSLTGEKRVSLGINTELIKDVVFGEKLAYLLGFEKNPYTEPDFYKNEGVISLDKDNDTTVHYVQQDAWRQTETLGGCPETMYVYCSIVENQIVGNKSVPLLRIVNTEGSFGEVISRTFDNPHYVPILLKDFQVIEINIKDDMNNLTSFSFGKVIVKLHLRKRSSFLLD
jgi:hypothetical protein